MGNETVFLACVLEHGWPPTLRKTLYRDNPNNIASSDKHRHKVAAWYATHMNSGVSVDPNIQDSDYMVWWQSYKQWCWENRHGAT